MKEKFFNWCDKPITWGASLKLALWGTVIYMISCVAWLIGYGHYAKRIREFRERMNTDSKIIKRKSKYCEVTRDVEE